MLEDFLGKKLRIVLLSFDGFFAAKDFHFC